MNLTRYGVNEDIQGGIIQDLERQVENNFNRFEPYNDNPLHQAFFKAYPRGEETRYLDLVYDYDNIAYAGILFKQPGKTLRLNGFGAKYIVMREVMCYDTWKTSHKYNQVILPGYRKIIEIRDGVFEYSPIFSTDVARILLEVSEYWNE
jgi:hypothetical protein